MKVKLIRFINPAEAKNRRSKAKKTSRGMTKIILKKLGGSRLKRVTRMSILKKHISRCYPTSCRWEMLTWANLLLENIDSSYVLRMQRQLFLRCTVRLRRHAGLRTTIFTNCSLQKLLARLTPSAQHKRCLRWENMVSFAASWSAEIWTLLRSGTFTGYHAKTIAAICSARPQYSKQ